MTQCPECSAQFGDAETCFQRFDALLALDHSRREPWGSRHGQAFAAFALQHPDTHERSLDAAWDSLYRIYCLGESPSEVFNALRKGPRPFCGIARPSHRARPFGVTIAHLGDFAAATYPAALDSWCRSALAGWGAPIFNE